MSEQARVYREFGSRLKLHRESREMSVSDLAESIGKSTRTIERYESGKQSIDLHVVYRLADALGVGVGRLVTPPSEWKSKSRSQK